MTTNIQTAPDFTYCSGSQCSVHLGTWDLLSHCCQNRKKGMHCGVLFVWGRLKTVITFESSRDVCIQMSSRWLELCLSGFWNLTSSVKFSICFPVCVMWFQFIFNHWRFSMPSFFTQWFCTLRWECHVYLVSLIFPQACHSLCCSQCDKRKTGPQGWQTISSHIVQHTRLSENNACFTSTC